jgi:prophage antirepressor-like protein
MNKANKMLDNNVVLFDNTKETIVKLFENTEIRIIRDSNNKLWFVLSDLLKSLNTSTTVTAAKSSINQGLGEGLVRDQPLLTEGGIQQVICISKEATLYLVAKSNTETGFNLRRFIYLEVLPEIEQTGSFNSSAISNKLSSYDKEFADIKSQLSLIVTNGIATNRPTIKLVGMNKRELNGGIDIETFCNDINRDYNRSYSRNVIYNILRTLNYIKEGSTEPTDEAYRNGFIDLAAGYIFYSDGTRSKTTKTIITEKTFDIIINYMKGKRYI